VKEYKIFIKLNSLLLLGVQINLVSLPLINFHKFTDRFTMKSEFCVTILKEENRGLTLINPHRPQYSRKKSFVVQR